MSNLVDESINLVRSGNRQAARELLRRAIIENPRDVRAWYLLSQVVDDPQKAIQCLEQALELQPNNLQIKEKLESLKRPEPLPELNLETKPQRPVEISEKPKKKTAWWVYVLLIVFVPILICLCIGMIWGSTDSSGGVSNPLKLTHTLTYRVDGSASTALITYMNDQTGMEQVNNAQLPWEKTYEMNTGSATSLVAQSSDPNRDITCIIDLDGKEWKRSSSSGDYVVVTCTGWIGLK